MVISIPHQRVRKLEVSADTVPTPPPQMEMSASLKYKWVPARIKRTDSAIEIKYGLSYCVTCFASYPSLGTWDPYSY